VKFWIGAVGAPSPARIAARSFRVLLAPLTYIRVGDAAPTVRFFAMLGLTYCSRMFIGASIVDFVRLPRTGMQHGMPHSYLEEYSIEKEYGHDHPVVPHQEQVHQILNACQTPTS
jgi:hypothetical protein